MNPAVSIIEVLFLLPLAVGILLFLVPANYGRLKGIIALATAASVLFFAFRLRATAGGMGQIDLMSAGLLEGFGSRSLREVIGLHTMLCLDTLSCSIMVLIGFFTVLILLYTLAGNSAGKAIRHFESLILLTLWASVFTVLSDSLFMFIFFWGFLGLTLYKLIEGKDEEGAAAAKKTLILIGASDGIMILGIGILWKITGHFNISEITVRTSDPIRICAFLALMIGSFTKAGAFPFHTWVPDFTKKAPAASSAYLPAALDKLIGIYFLVRICHDMFRMSPWIRMILLAMGLLTIIVGVMMALVQHNYKRLLGYHAVSQVGYMVTGIALGSVLGLAGGLFHMVNNAIYKSGLFLAAGNVKERTGTDDLEQVGGLSGQMPITFICSLVFALSISGIPPLNGFASKWIIYQAIIDFGKGAALVNQLWIVWLSLAVIGSALTLASFIKFISGVFLGRRKAGLSKVKEVHWLMWTPVAVLSLLCIGFGVFASKWVIPRLFEPIAGTVAFTGLWDSSAVSLLILLSLFLGILFYLVFSKRRFRTDDAFIGGETNSNEVGFESVNFYETIRNFGIFRQAYAWAEQKYFDLYDVTKGLVLRISSLLSAAHDGILSNLAFWVLAGLIFMFIFLLM